MAWDFAAQIHALTGFDADSSDNTEVGETFRTMTAQWLKDAAKEVINILPLPMLKMCTSMQTFGDVSKAPGSEAEVLNTSKVLSVFAGEYQARQIPSELKYKANDSDSLQYATSTDPVFYIEGNKINILPSGLTAANLKYEEVQYPSPTYDATSIGGTSYVATGITATAADPTVFTKLSHSFSDDDLVKLSNFTEMTEINGMTGTVNKLTSDTFEVNGIAADPAETTGGTVEKIGSGFPDEAENLVVLKTSIIALEHLLAIEEDVELYAPTLANLRQDYMQQVNALVLGTYSNPRTKETSK
tara:strand:+ start:192 stop:1094 length:903 start_codon:yes stop_codon:yes gene_type:complete